MKYIEGELRLSATKGIGYVTPTKAKKEAAVEIHPACLNTALDGDLVRVRLLPASRDGKETGEVIAVVRRKRLEFVGVIEKTKAGFRLLPDDSRLYARIKIAEDKSRGARAGDKVLVHLLSWKDSRTDPLGEIVKVIGKPGDHNTEMVAIVYEHGFVPRFPPAVEAEAKNIKWRATEDLKKETPRRRDLRQILTLTIDPADAKDFDDAVSLKELPSDRLEIGIHIADVAHYVKPDTVIDQEARRRATSIYLVDRTVPMLPEVLSNDLCSLNPNEDKLTFSAVFIFNKKFEIENEWFGRTIIRSKKRFAYEEVQKILNEKSGLYAPQLGILDQLAQKLRAEKLAGGAIDFAQQEIKFVLDKKGRPIKVIRKDRTRATMLIEDLMLLANRKVAEFVSRIVGNKAQSFVYRVHDRPSIEKIKSLAEFIGPLGHRLKVGKNEITARSINELLKAVAGTPEEGMVQTITLRSMAKAAYSTKNIGHYGLAFAHYAHFTSPIRRYPDLMVHRLLDFYLRGKQPSEKMLRLYDELAVHCSERELEAQEAERESIKYKQVEYLTNKIGQVFSGTISGITKWGVYVQEQKTLAEGMVRLAEMKNDYYIFDEKNYALVGRHTKRRFRLGDQVHIKLLRTNLHDRQLDFAFV